MGMGMGVVLVEKRRCRRRRRRRRWEEAGGGAILGVCDWERRKEEENRPGRPSEILQYGEEELKRAMWGGLVWARPVELWDIMVWASR
jgi:hypothetical protein